MPYTVDFLPKFSKEFANFPAEHRKKVLDFVMLYQQHGLSDFSIYKGKVAPSWIKGDTGNPNYYYAKGHHLWHYHIGVPIYENRHGKYLTSDVVLHFQWPGKGNRICLVDMYDHYTSDGNFYLPPQAYLNATP